jgi:hypothetical protein
LDPRAGDGIVTRRRGAPSRYPIKPEPQVPMSGLRSNVSPAVIVVAAIALGAFWFWRRRTARGAGKIERRRAPRFIPPRDMPAELQIIGTDVLEIPKVVDISDNGLAISVPHEFNGQAPEQHVDLLLTLHGQGTVRARSTIRHVSRGRADTTIFGVELNAMSEDDRAKLRNYLAAIVKARARVVPEWPKKPAADLHPAHARARK